MSRESTIARRAYRGPPGQWRLLAPALVAWALAAHAITAPGTGRIVAVASALGGACTLGVVVWRAVRRRAGVWAAVARGSSATVAVLGLALLLLLGLRIEWGEAVRDDATLREAAAAGTTQELSVTLSGYAVESSDRRAWAAATFAGARGRVPLVLWFEAGDARGGGGSSGGGSADDSGGGDSSGVGDSGGGGPSGRAGAAQRGGWGPGSEVLVRGVPVRLDAGSGAAFGIRIVAAAAEKSDGSLATAAADLRARLRDAAAATPGAALVPGLAVGDTSLVAAQTDRQMRDASLTHLVAVSGANCALVTSAAGWVLARCGAGRRIRILGQGAVLAGFVFVVGPDPSVQRAAVMAVVVLVSQYGGRRAIALPALASAVIVLLLRDPWQALHPGFALSVAATAGILIIAPPLTRALRLRARVPELVALPIAVACAAQFACAPLLLLLQPGLPLVGVLANVLAAPGAPLGTGLGLLALVLLPLSEPLGALAVWVAALPARWLVGTAAVTSELPYARAPWPEGWGGAALLAAAELLLGTAWWLGTHRGAHTRPRARPGLRRAGKGEADPGWRHPWSAREPALRGASRWSLGLAAAGLGLLLGPTALTPAVTRAAAPRDWSVVACDVGQGDALLLRDPARPGGVTLVDTGEDPDALLACLDRFSVGRIELLIVSHDHRDHFGALDAVIRRVDRALIAPANREDGADRALVRQLEAAGVPVTVGVAGMHGGGGVLGVAGMHGGGGGEDGGGVQWLVLGPAAGHVPADANSASVIARLRAGAVSVLLLGDTGALVQSELLRGGADLRADVLKVAHHGSRDQNRELPGRVAADLALVSVGASNRYGHPAPGTLADLAAAGTATARTDQLGSIAVSGAPGSLRVWASERGPPE